jgi:hypothetical protein
LIKAGVEGSGQAKGDVLGDDAVGGELALGADDHDAIADGRADIVRKACAEDDGREGGSAGLGGGIGLGMLNGVELGG